jgi:glycosyltransferase involved in cell wall biosynthesis
VAGFIRQTKPDVVNLQYQAAAYQMHPAINLLPAMLSQCASIVVTFHDLRVPYLFPKAGPLRWQAIVTMARAARAVIVTNVEDEDTLRQAGLARVFRIPIGSNITPANLEGFDRGAWLRAHGAPDNAHTVGYFGFLNESKGGETLIRALAELRAQGLDVKLVLIGGQTGDSDPTNQSYARRLMKLAGELGAQAHIIATGFLDPSGVSAAFAACDCVALPYRDGASLRRGTLMAALAHGSAIVTTTPRVALPELQHEQNTLLVPPDDPPALAAAIRRALTDAALRRRLQEGSLRASRLFTWDHIAAQTMRVFAAARDEPQRNKEHKEGVG